MDKKQIKRNLVLGILFFLPVTFLLLLYPAKHNYNPLEVVKSNVLDISNLTSVTPKDIILKDHITVLGFLGKNPESLYTQVSNLKELVYDKFKGFKKFQLVLFVSEGSEAEVKRLKLEISKYSDLKFWHFVYADDSDTKQLFNSLRTSVPLNADLASNSVYIVDKVLDQRGRLDDRTDKEKEKNSKVYPLLEYDCAQVAILKNTMSVDLRVLFTEYREKRKGNFNSTSRRADDLKQEHNKN